MAYEKINELLEQLKKSKSELETINTGISLSNEILAIFGASRSELHYGEEVLDKAFPTRKFKNQKMEQWYAKHPYMGSARVALDLFSGQTVPVESKFYKLNESANKAKISASTQIDSNWEDNELTMKPQYKIGIDFFLKSDESSLLVVLTNKGNLRVLEISDHLSKTQIEILDNVKNCFLFTGLNSSTGKVEEFEPQRTIHKNLWNAFALQSVNKKFYQGVAESFEILVQYIERNLPVGISNLESKNDIKLFSTRLLGRLLFLWFLKKKNIINTHIGYFDLENYNSSDYYDLKLKDLFFGTLNTPVDQRSNQDNVTPYLNGGLFDPHPNDWASNKVQFPLNWFENLFQHFNSFNFTTDESSPEYEQIAIDPEMLGRVFENLLATIVPETSKAASEKKDKGAFYTPRDIVDYMSKQSLKYYLKRFVDNPKDDDGIDKLVDMNDAELLEKKSTGKLELWGNRSEEVITKIIEGLDKIKILDPACGSGAYPMGMLQLMVRTFDRLSAIYDEKAKNHRPIIGSERNDVYKTKLSIIQKSLYGVDIVPMATEISRLRSWLSLIVDGKGDIEPLPNLDFNFVCANSLLPLDKPIQINMFENLEYENEIEKLREEYFQIHDKKSKLLLKEKFTALYSTNLEIDTETRRVQQLRSWNPFEADKSAEFFDSKIMFNVDSFDIVIGNPPYGADIDSLSSLYKKIYPGVTKSYIEIYKMFFSFGMNVLKVNGILTFITPNTFLSQPKYKDLRLFLIKYDIDKIINLGEKVFEQATVSTCISVFQNSKNIDGYKFADLSIGGKYKGSLEGIVFKNIKYNQIMQSTDISFMALDESTLDYYPLDTIFNFKDGGIKYQRYGIGLKSKGGNDLYERIFSSEKDKFQNSIQTWYGKKLDKYFLEKKTNEFFNLDYKKVINKNEIVYFSNDAFTVKQKIMWRQTAPYLVAMIDEDCKWFRNTIQCGWLKEEFKNDFNLYFILGLFNSKYFKYLYSRIVNEDSGRAFPQVKITYLRKLPIIKCSLSKQNEIVEIVKNIIELKQKSNMESSLLLENKIDDIIVELYKLTDLEKEAIKHFDS